MQWINFEDRRPPLGVKLVTLKTYLDAPFGENGYENEKEFWTDPEIEVDSYEPICGILGWKKGGHAICWGYPEVHLGVLGAFHRFKKQSKFHRDSYEEEPANDPHRIEKICEGNEGVRKESNWIEKGITEIASKIRGKELEIIEIFTQAFAAEKLLQGMTLEEVFKKYALHTDMQQKDSVFHNVYWLQERETEEDPSDPVWWSDPLGCEKVILQENGSYEISDAIRYLTIKDLIKIFKALDAEGYNSIYWDCLSNVIQTYKKDKGSQ